ncbi:MAG: glycosyltransferase family 2 protein [Phycisphaeraceae bacterium]|nr:glycosyltransferase family 2 protein [Phycisphaeraceae bacterium]
MISVIIPTFRRTEKLCNCLGALANQTLAPDDYEVVVAVDGFEPRTHAAAAAAWSSAWSGRSGSPANLIITQGPHGGPGAARALALASCSGDTLLFLNDDVIPEPDCLQEHVDAHARLAAQGRSAMIIGDAPWRVHTPDNRFAQMLRETSMVFFYDRMHAALREPGHNPDHDWGFRHAWMLNLSASARDVREAGGVQANQHTYGREDDELAFRLSSQRGMPVLFRPRARVVHDHAMSPREYLKREYGLGYTALAFSHKSPACALELFRMNLADPAVRTQTAGFVEQTAGEAAGALGWFESLATQPPLPPGQSAQALRTQYEQHLPLKRWMWRRALLDALSGAPAEPEAALARLRRLVGLAA